MSIVPVGKNRHQVNQGGFKHESMLETDAFERIFKQALAPGTVVDQVDQDVEVPGDLQSAMDQGGLDRNRTMPEGADGVGRMQNLNAAPDEWKFDPKTGEPLTGLSGEEAYKKAYEIFAQMNLSVEVRGDLHGANWQVIITPAKGRAVSKN